MLFLFFGAVTRCQNRRQENASTWGFMSIPIRLILKTVSTTSDSVRNRSYFCKTRSRFIIKNRSKLGATTVYLGSPYHAGKYSHFYDFTNFLPRGFSHQKIDLSMGILSFKIEDKKSMILEVFEGFCVPA